MIHRIFVTFGVIALGGFGLCLSGAGASWTSTIYEPAKTSRRVLSLSQKRHRDTQSAQQWRREAEQQRLRDALKIARKIENRHKGLLVKASSLLGVDAEEKKKLTSAVKSVGFGVVSKGLETYASTGRYYKPKASKKSLKQMRKMSGDLRFWLTQATIDFHGAIESGAHNSAYVEVLATQSIKDRLNFIEQQFTALNKVLRDDKRY
jgi:hypothetical protein